MKKIYAAIPAYNEENTIGKLLDSINKQRYSKENMAVVIANNASSDKTLDVIDLFSQENPTLKINIEYQPVRGIAPTRKCALDFAASQNPDLLLNVDADCILPPFLIKKSLRLIGKNKHAIVCYRLMYPQIANLILWVHFRPILETMHRLAQFQERLLGPLMYTGCLLIPTALYKKLYWEDVLNPIIPDDDYLLSRRFHAMGVNFIRSEIEVFTSGRRFWGNNKKWLEHVHEGNYRDELNKKLFPLNKREIKIALKKRVEKATDRVLMSLVEYMFLDGQSHSKYYQAKSTALAALTSLGLPETVFKKVKESEKLEYYLEIKKKYYKNVEAILKKHVDRK